MVCVVCFVKVLRFVLLQQIFNPLNIEEDNTK